MPNIIDSIQISGVTYTLSGGSGGGGGNNVIELTQTEYDALTTVDPTAIYVITDAEEINANDYVTKSANAASGYSYVRLIPSNTTFQYTEQYRPTLTIKYINGTNTNTGTYSIGNLSIWRSSTMSSSINPNVQLLNGVITGVTNLSYATATVEDGVAIITLDEGYYLRSVNISNGFGYFEVENYSSGQSKNVIENTIYNVLDTVSDDIITINGRTVGSTSFSVQTNRNLYSYINGVNGYNLASAGFMFYDGDTIKYNSSKGLHLAPVEGDYYWKKEDLSGSSNYCSWPSSQLPTYADTWKKVRLKLNPSYSSSNNLQIRIFVGGVADKTQTYFNQTVGATIFFDSINNTLNTNNVIGTYCISNITYDSTSNIIEITMDENNTYNGSYYGITYINQSNCWIGTNYLITEIYNWTNEHSPIDYIMENKQDTLSAGTGIDITNNVISVTGGSGGGGTTYTAGRGISISADTISLEPKVITGNGESSIILNEPSGNNGTIYNRAEGSRSTSIGYNVRVYNSNEIGVGLFNNSFNDGDSTSRGLSGNTLFTVGNGNGALQRHNAFEVRGNGDIYIADTNDTSTSNFYAKPMIKLQDTIAATAANTSALGGLSLVKLTQTEYDALVTKDSNTLYIVTDS